MTTEMFTMITVYVLAGLVGLCVGSFLNVVIYRVPLGMSLSSPASHCPKCDYKLRWYDNIPVLSYIMLGGKCRSCKEKISPRYMLVELSNAVLWLACVWRFGVSDWRAIVSLVASALALSTCLCIAFIDLEHKLIFDRFQIIMAVLAVAYTVADTSTPWWSHPVAAVAGGVIFWFIGWLVSKKAGREALGGGDVKFAFVSGLFLGWEKLLVMMIVASVSGSIILMILNGKNKENENEKDYPFAPFLTAGFAIAVLFGEALISAYLHLMGLE